MAVSGRKSLWHALTCGTLIEGKAAVIISHRFSTVRMADRILFLEHGQLLELGSHEELIAKDGKYAELFHLQAQGYD